MNQPSRKPLLAAVAVALVLALLLGVVLAQMARAADAVAMDGGDPARSGTQPGPAPVGDLTAATFNDQLGSGPVSPIALGSILYRIVNLPAAGAGESGGQAIEAINLASAESLWTKPLAIGGAARSGLALMNDALFFVNSTLDQAGGETTSLVAIRIDDGDVKWSVPVGQRGGATSGSPAFANGVVYWVDPDGTAHAVIADTGKLAWTSRAAKAAAPPVDESGNFHGVSSLNQFAIGDGQLDLVNSDGVVAALKLTDGSLIWSFNVAQRYGIAPLQIQPHAYDGGVLLDISAKNSANSPSESEFTALATVIAQTGGGVWKQFLRQRASGVALADGKAIVSLVREGMDGQDVAAYDLASGGTLWQYASKYIAAADGGIMVAGGSAYVAGEGGFLFELSLANGAATTLYEYPDGASTARAMFVAGGHIVLVDGNGGLVILSGGGAATPVAGTQPIHFVAGRRGSRGHSLAWTGCSAVLS